MQEYLVTINISYETSAKSKAEALEIRDWFVDKEGSLDTFVFTEPLEDVPYDVQFKEDAFKIQRIGQDAFNITVVLEEDLNSSNTSVFLNDVEGNEIEDVDGYLIKVLV